MKREIKIGFDEYDDFVVALFNENNEILDRDFIDQKDIKNWEPKQITKFIGETILWFSERAYD